MSTRLFPARFCWTAGTCFCLLSAGCGGGSNGISAKPTVALDSIAFVSTRDGAPEIYLMNPDGSQQTRVTSGIGSANNPSQSRGGRIVFESDRDGNSEIYAVNRDGSGLQRLTNDSGGPPFSDGQPVLSPDGKTIAWSSTRGDAQNSSSNIWLMDANGQNKRQLVFNTAPADDFATLASTDPAWTADGKQLAYQVIPRKDRPIGNNGIQLVTLATGEVTPVDYSFGRGSHLRFDNGRKIIYSSPFARSNGAFLATYDFATGASTRGPSAQMGAESFDFAPDYSPDGQSIVWQAIVDGKPAQIYRAQNNGDGLIALTAQGENYSPDW